MSIRWLTALFGSKSHDRLPLLSSAQSNQDAAAAITELTRAIKHNPEAIELCSALGNLYRLRGELDQAIQVRSALVERPGLLTREKARIYLELGRDYARAGLLDRAQDAFFKAKELGETSLALEQELAELFAKGAQFLEASSQYKCIGAIPQAAHFLVRAACTEVGNVNRGLLAEALEMYPASPEAWLETITLLVHAQAWDELLLQIRQGLEVMLPELGFLLLEPLLAQNQPEEFTLSAAWLTDLTQIISEQPQDLALAHACGRLLCAYGLMEEATTWQEKALLLNSSFWPARLELLTMFMAQQQLTPGFALQLEFLLERAREVKRFICAQCGLKRREVFFCCPKCQSWHSISFRKILSD